MSAEEPLIAWLGFEAAAAKAMGSGAGKRADWWLDRAQKFGAARDELSQLRELRDVILHNVGTNEPVIDFTLAVRLAQKSKR